MTCPECGTENRPTARTCEFCNAALTTSPAPSPSPASQAAQRLVRSRQIERMAAPVLGGIALLLVVLIVVLFPKEKIQESAPDLALEYPTVTIDRYYGALAKRDYAAAYGTLSARVRAQLTEAQFAQACASESVSSFTILDSGPTDGTETYAAVKVDGTPQFVWLVREEEGWRIAWTPLLERVLNLPCPV